MSQSFEDIANTRLSESAAPSAESFSQGQVVVGKYRIISLLGRGGIGSVYKVEQVFLGQLLALKTLNSQTASDQLIRRFQNEARAASSLSHPNLVKVIDFGLVEGQHPYLVMDFVDGITLNEHLKENGLFNLEQAVGCFAQVCLGLSYAHDQGIVHRDIKPSNIMISRSLPFGAEGFVKVVDFGIAKVVSAEDGELQSLTATGEIFGSPLYMSPEQCSGAAVDHRADIYSLGCVLFESLTGTSPFVGQNALATMMLHQSEKPPTLKEASLGKDFPPALEQLVANLLSKNPADRYQNLGVVANDLAQIVKGAPVLGISPREKREIKIYAPVKMTRGEFRKWITVVALGVAFVSGAIGYFTAQCQSDNAVSTGKSNAIKASQPAASRPVQDSAEKSQKYLSNWKKACEQVESYLEDNDRITRFRTEYYAAREMVEKASPEHPEQIEMAKGKLSALLGFVGQDDKFAHEFQSGLEERIAYCNARLHHYREAEVFLRKAIKSSFKDDAKVSIGKTYAYMANEMKGNGDFKKALDYRRQAAKAFSDMCEIDGIAQGLAADAARESGENYRNCAAICFENFQDCESADKYCVSAKRMFELVHDDYIEGMLYMLHGAALTGLKRFAEAKAALSDSIRLLTRVKPGISADDAPLYLTNSYRQLSAIALLSHDYETARQYYLMGQKVLLRYQPIASVNVSRREEELARIVEDLKNLPQQNAVK